VLGVNDDAYARAAVGPYKGLLSYTEAPIVSTDIASCGRC